VAIARPLLPRLVEALRATAPAAVLPALHSDRLFGSDVAVRALSGGVAALLLLSADGRPAATVTLVLAAANPWLIRYATEAHIRPEVLLVRRSGGAGGCVAAAGPVRRRAGPGDRPAAADPLLAPFLWAVVVAAVVGTGGAWRGRGASSG
jgi:hypothetical protein